MRVAFVTCSALPDGWHDDHAAARLLDASFRSWDDPSVDWVAFDRVVIRSAWDYTARAGEFVAWCDAVGAQRLRNVPSLVAFNADKRYLAELEVPSRARRVRRTWGRATAACGRGRRQAQYLRRRARHRTLRAGHARCGSRAHHANPGERQGRAGSALPGLGGRAGRDGALRASISFPISTANPSCWSWRSSSPSSTSPRVSVPPDAWPPPCW